VFKCRKQIDPKAYGSLYNGLTNIYRTSGLKGLYVGYQPTILGYSLQGSTKYGFYEIFKGNILQNHTTLRYLISSALAEVIADCFLCPMESLKVRMQTSKNFTTNFVAGFREIMS